MRPVQAQLAFDELGTPLRDTTFVVFDLETTGAAPGPNGITEIGAVKVRAGEVLGEFATLVNPGVPIPPQIVSLTGITHAMVYDAPPIEEVLPAFLEFIGGSVLVAHNSGFDTSHMRAACEGHGYVWPKATVVCTVRLARRVVPRDEVGRYNLTALALLFGARTRPTHRALDDARATVDVLHGLLERVGNLGVHSLEELMGYLPEVTVAQRAKRHLAADLPAAPGVYLFRGPKEEVLYVGTAKDLRRRVRTYFTGSEGRSRIREMVALAERVDHVVCAHSLEAEVRELRLIGAHRPAYNRRSKNRHQGWWVGLTDEAFPRLSVVRLPRPGCWARSATRPTPARRRTPWPARRDCARAPSGSRRRRRAGPRASSPSWAAAVRRAPAGRTSRSTARRSSRCRGSSRASTAPRCAPRRPSWSGWRRRSTTSRRPATATSWPA